MPPKSAISLARARPTSRGSSQETPQSRDRLRLAKIIESRARSLQTTRSQPRASDRPAPTATPSNLAMVGLVIRCRARARSPRRRMRASPERVGSVAGPLGSERSAPEQKAPPAPVSTRARSSPRSSTSRNVSRSSVSMTPLAAFLRSGRFMVTVTTPSLRWTIRVSMGRPYAAELSERTFVDVEGVPGGGRHVEPHVVVVHALAGQIRRGQSAQTALLDRGHRFERMAERVGRTRLDLADDQGGAAGRVHDGAQQVD